MASALPYGHASFRLCHHPSFSVLPNFPSSSQSPHTIYSAFNRFLLILAWLAPSCHIVHSLQTSPSDRTVLNMQPKVCILQSQRSELVSLLYVWHVPLSEVFSLGFFLGVMLACSFLLIKVIKFGPQFQVVVQYAGQVMAAGAWGSWLNYIHSQKAQKEECWCSVTSTLFM